MNRSICAVFIFFSMTVSLAAAETAQVIKWDNLIPPSSPLEDPFKDLTIDQLYDLENLAYLSEGLKNRQGPNASKDKENVAKLTEFFKSAKLDVESLLAQYTGFQEEIVRRNRAVVGDMEGRLVRLAGYVLPLEFSGSGVNEFLLVPYIGACIHVPPPPPNQIVYVRLNQTMNVDDSYIPVWVTGKMTIKPTNKDLSLVDGQGSIPVGYTLDAIRVDPYKK